MVDRQPDACPTSKASAHAVSNTGRRELYGYLAFYRTYPQIVRAPSALSAQAGAHHRHTALHPQGPRASRVRAGGHEQYPVRLALSGATAGQERNGGLPAQGSGRVGTRG